MDAAFDEEIEQQGGAWKAKYNRDYDRLTESITANRNNWTAKAFLELRNNLQVIDTLNDALFALSKTLRRTQKRLVVAEQRLSQLEQDRSREEMR